MNDSQKMKVGFALLAVFLAVTLSLVWYSAIRTYEISGTVADLQSTPEGEHPQGRYTVILTDGQTLAVRMSLFHRTAESDQQLYESLRIGEQYTFTCWGETPRIFEITQ
jgi:hypothetical protein